jgi:hypothetical protein
MKTNKINMQDPRMKTNKINMQDTGWRSCVLHVYFVCLHPVSCVFILFVFILCLVCLFCLSLSCVLCVYFVLFHPVFCLFFLIVFILCFVCLFCLNKHNTQDEDKQNKHKTQDEDKQNKHTRHRMKTNKIKTQGTYYRQKKYHTRVEILRSNMTIVCRGKCTNTCSITFMAWHSHFIWKGCAQPDWGYLEWTEQIISINSYKLI